VAKRHAKFDAMRNNSISRFHQVLRIAALGAMLCIPPTSSFARSGAFSNMAGSWFGSGRIYMSDGTNERIRCRARYAVAKGGYVMQQNLLCASPSYRFDINSTVTDDNGRIFGTWSETAHNVTGNVTGIARGGHIQASVNGGEFRARLALITHGNSQMVTIVPNGTDVREVAVALQRG
jgi:hypothetical protein